MKKIELNAGRFALVDDEDFEKVNAYRWFTRSLESNEIPYAIRNITIDGKQTTQQMSRFIMNTSKDMICDHIDHNTLNNQKTNLRNCTKHENARNSKIRDNKSGYKGVYEVKDHFRKKKWMAQIRVDGKQKMIGYFETAKDAALAYDECAKFEFGEFAFTNF